MSPEKTQSDPHNILVIDLGQLGDVVLSLPALQAIRHRFPASHITCMTGKSPGELVRMSGFADEVFAVDRVELRDGPKLTSIGMILGIVRDIRGRSLDLVIDLHSLPETNLLAFLSRAPARLLANRESRSIDRLSNFDPPPPREDKSKHQTDRYLDVLKPLGIADAPRNVVLEPRPEYIEAVSERYFANGNDRRVGLFPGAGHPSRCWPLDRFAELAIRLNRRGMETFVFLGPEESGMRDQVLQMFPDSTVADGLSIGQFIAAASFLDAFVTNDTGPVHLAACAGAPIVLLLDERAPTTYLPNAERIEVVRNSTIDSISVDDAERAAGRLLDV